ncbi:MAG: hypothetical protein PUP93_05285 [Rhizonema sp. NSF051]|nr:hypothetical protein [Rhizonema sp. NSF051]
MASCCDIPQPIPRVPPVTIANFDNIFSYSLIKVQQSYLSCETIVTDILYLRDQPGVRE